jgi:hypothetical protein
MQQLSCGNIDCPFGDWGLPAHTHVHHIKAIDAWNRRAANPEVERLRTANAELAEALKRLCARFPTAVDMDAAGVGEDAISAACNAYDAARAALKSVEAKS